MASIKVCLGVIVFIWSNCACTSVHPKSDDLMAGELIFRMASLHIYMSP